MFDKKDSIIKIGVLGCANIALRFIIPEIHELNKVFKLTGIASRNRDKVDKCARKYNTVAYYSYEELIENTELQAIYIPLPNALHAKWIEKALNRGIHVLVEKSLACSFSEVQILNELAKQKGCVLIENFQFRFHEQLKIIQDLVSCGTIGDLRGISSSFGFPPFSDNNNIRYQKELGGGALLDAGAYTIKISEIFLGEEIEVKAASLKKDKLLGIDQWGGGFIKQKFGDIFSKIAFGFDNFYQCNIELWGSKGKIYTNRIFTAPPGYEAEIFLEKPNEMKIIKVKPDNHFQNMLLHFHNNVINENQRETEYQQNINQARLIENFKQLAYEQ